MIVETVVVCLQFTHISCMLVAVSDITTCLFVKVLIRLSAKANKKTRVRKREGKRLGLACSVRKRRFTRSIVVLATHNTYTPVGDIMP